ncbi:MAG: DUF2309 domain-containing protein [Deltaproteobacteria bacterium]|nr:DUF2309 domain-containing protein [Deltaproteobacteria bacterium]
MVESLLALRGWAGMIRQVETRPDRVPSHAPPARLEDFLAIRLIADRAGLEHLGARRRFGAPAPAAEPDAPALRRAFLLFQIAQLVGRTSREIDALTGADAAQILGDLDAFPGTERRRLLHRAYERRYRVEILDALAAHSERRDAPAAARPAYQTVMCIDEREESLRRHLEEIDPAVETFGAAGFFGVAMYYRGAADARPRPLCPVTIRPEHEVEERVIASREQRTPARRRDAWKRVIGRLRRSVDVGSRAVHARRRPVRPARRVRRVSADRPRSLSAHGGRLAALRGTRHQNAVPNAPHRRARRGRPPRARRANRLHRGGDGRHRPAPFCAKSDSLENSRGSS